MDNVPYSWGENDQEEVLAQKVGEREGQGCDAFLESEVCHSSLELRRE